MNGAERFSAGAAKRGRGTSGVIVDGVDKSALIGDLTNADKQWIQGNSTGVIVAVFIAVLLGIAGVALAFGLTYGLTVRYINGVGPDDGSVTLVGGTGILIVPDTATSSITVINTGIVGGTPGAGLSTTIEEGVSSLGVTLVEQSLLTESDPNGPQVQYEITMPGVPQNTWRVTTSGAFPGAFVPGVIAGDGGQGNVGGTAWTAPAVGEYAFNAYCSVVPSAYIPNDYMSASMALSLGATTVDPTTGTIPAGGRSSLDLSVGSNGAVGPAVPSALSVSAHVHVCPTCLVTVGQSVLLHTRLDHVGAVPGPARLTTSTYGLLAGTSTTTVGATTITGDLGVSPGATETGPYVVTGATNLNNAAAIQAQLDLTTLYTYLASQPCTAVLQGTDLGGLTLTAGVYCFTSSGALTGTVNLDGQGNPNARFIFKFGSTLTTAASSGVTFANSAQACNVYWQVGSSATMGATNTFAGSVVALTSITVGAGGTFAGPLMARNGVVTFAGVSSVFAATNACAAAAAASASFACFLQVSREK